MKYSLISGSLRSGSIHTELLQKAAHELSLSTNAIVNLNKFSIPLYNGDVEAVGIPEGVMHLAGVIQQSQALIIASPEYNYSISGVFKNMIDWVSRVRPMPLSKKPVLLLSASPGQIAGIRGVWHTRIPLEGLGNYVYPQMFSLGNFFQNFVDGKFVNPDDQKRFLDILKGFKDFAAKFCFNE